MSKTKRIAFLFIFTLVALTALLNPYIGITRWFETNPSASASQSISVTASDYPGSATMEASVAFWQNRIANDSEDYIAYNHLGAALINQARATGDIGTYERAESAFRQALVLHPHDLAANSYLATVLFIKHDFTQALDVAGQVYDQDRAATQALAIIGDARLETGDYAGAAHAYQDLQAAGESPATWSRIAHLQELNGQPQDALKWMLRAADESQTHPSTRENAAWYQVQVGDLYFNRGDVEKAAQRYSTALGIFDNYYLGLARLAQARAAQGRVDEAIQLYQHAIAIIPNPDFIANLGDLYAQQNKLADAKKQYDTVEFIGKLAAINKIIYNRQLVLFYANHDLMPQQALALAAAELQIRQDIYGYDAYAWALYKNGRYADALAAVQQALSLGTRDAKLYYHAGMIYKGLGQTAPAREFLTRALSLNPHFDLLQASRAVRALQELK